MVCRVSVAIADLKRSQHYPERFGLAITECFLEHYPMVKKNVEERRAALEAKPLKEAKDRVAKQVS